jgi:hypothetical protein
MLGTVGFLAGSYAVVFSNLTELAILLAGANTSVMGAITVCGIGPMR